MGKIVVIVGILLLVGGGIFLWTQTPAMVPPIPTISPSTSQVVQQPATTSSEKKVEEVPLQSPPLFSGVSWKEEGGISPMEVISLDGEGKKLSGTLSSYAENFATMEAFNG
ncbi:MAG: hypothetical protein Q7R79_03545, partial [bacterium]|nr:hypothetical protein [bacterium]